MNKLQNIERKKALETAPSVEFAKEMIINFIENQNLRTDGYFKTSTDECACGETLCVVYEIEREGFISVTTCETCGVDNASCDDYINVNC